MKPKQANQKKEGAEKKEGKGQSKKLVKTVFNSPFRYKMYPSIKIDRPFPSRPVRRCSPF